MNGFVINSARSPDFQRTFVAMRYYWGSRDAALADAFGALPVHPATADLLQDLGHAERAKRAQALGLELGRLATALEQRSLLK